MSNTVSFGGVSYNLPANREPKGWGTQLAAFIVAVAQKALPSTGGTFALTAELNLGSTYGILAPYFKSASSTISSTGVIRFANNEGLGWRNAANSADLILKVDASNNLEYNGNDIPTAASKLSFFAATSSSELAGVISDETGTGALVFANTPTLVTPVLGVATATSINKLAITAPATAATLAIADGKTLTASNTLTFTGTDGSSVAFGAGGTAAYTSNKLSAFAATSSSELAGVISDETGSGSLVFGTNPTLDNPSFDNGATMLHESSVTTPASGRIKVFPKNDNRLYIVDSSGIETAVGTGSGSGGINYISNPDAESGTTGWATYADAAAATPVDGTGGSASITWTRNTTTPLRGNADFKLSKGATNRQGDGVAYDFTISVVDKTKKLQISFDLNTNTSNYAAGDLVAYIYDVTNSVLITPSSTSVPKLTGTFAVTFDSTTSTSYRLILHVATTNATAYDLYFDNFIVEQGILVQGAAIGAWQAWTPTGSWSSNVTYTGFWRQVGTDMEVDITVSASGATTAANLTVNLPSPYTIDTASLSSSDNTNKTYGMASVYDSGGDVYFMDVSYNDTGSFLVARAYVSGVYLIHAAVSNTAPITIGAGDKVYIRAKFPISQWAGNGTVNLGAGAQIEYAYNDSTNDANDSTSANMKSGPTGAQFVAFTSLRTKRVTFQYPIQQDDIITLEITSDGGVSWQEVGQNSTVYTFQNQNGVYYGAYVNPVSSTAVEAAFGTYRIASGATYGSAGSTWAGVATSNTYRWRIRKCKASSPVGFGLASANDSGLVKPRKSQYSLTVTSSVAGWSTARAVGIYYQDQDGNHRLKFNIAGTCTSGARTSNVLTVTGITFKNVTNYLQSVSAVNDAADGGCGAAASPNVSTISISHASATTAFYAASGDLELESKPSWA